MTYKSFEELEVYQVCRNFKKDIIEICKEYFSKEELLNEMRGKYRTCLRLLNGYIAYLKRRKDGNE